MHYPITAYHGTCADFEAFRPSTRGSFGAGVYTADEKAAELYAGDGLVLEVELMIARPYHYAASYDNDLDFDSAAVELVRELFPEPEASSLLMVSLHGDGLFGNEIPRALEARGYDGLIVTYEDGSQEIIAFRGEQVRILGRRPASQRQHAA